MSYGSSWVIFEGMPIEKNKQKQAALVVIDKENSSDEEIYLSEGDIAS